MNYYFSNRSTYHGIEELGWENGQPSTHDTVWVGPGDTLESIVHQATCDNQKPPPQNIKLLETEYQVNQYLTEKKSIVSSTKYCGENLSNMGMDPPIFTKKRGRSSEYYDQCRQINNFNSHQDHADMRSCASAAAAFCGESGDNNTTMTTWPSFESPRSMTTKFAEDSALHAVTKNPDEDIQTKNDTVQSKRSRTVAVHNQSERNRRDRINQRMETLQRLVPNTSKTDKASMLDKVIEYVKQLEAQVHMSGVRNMNTMMPLGMQEQLQMSPLDQMGMGVGLGMNMVSGINMGSMQDMTTFAQTATQPLSTSIHPHLATTADNPTFIPPQSMVPTVIPTNIQPQSSTAQGATNTNHIPFTDPYSSAFDPFSSAIDPYSASDPYSIFLAQSMNMDLDNKMEAPVCQQVNLATEALTGASNTTHMI